jgi:hypothetical protein
LLREECEMTKHIQRITNNLINYYAEKRKEMLRDYFEREPGPFTVEEIIEQERKRNFK